MTLEPPKSATFTGMIISASYRTDIPAVHADWFARRLAAGFCQVRNPYGGKPYRVDLSVDAVDGFVFWTRNPQPFLPVLDALAAAGRRFVLQVTVTGYPRAWEVATPKVAAVLPVLRRLVDNYGPEVLVWRYDPVILGPALSPDWQRQHFARLAAGIAGLSNEVVFSFAQMYVKTRRNMARAGLSWIDPTAAEKAALLADLATLAQAHGFAPRLCSQSDLMRPPLRPARCIDAQRFERISGTPMVARSKANRPGCLCAESRDIGAYDSCAHGCHYCYAVRDRQRAKQAIAGHDPGADML